MMLTDTTHSSFSHFPPRTALVAAQSALYALYANILPLRKASGEFFTFALGEQTLELKLTSISKKKIEAISRKCKFPEKPNRRMQIEQSQPCRSREQEAEVS